MADYQSQFTGLQIDEAIAAGIELKENPQQALANLGGRPNRNLAKNPDFKINQQRFARSDWRSGYGPDEWSSIGTGHLEYSGGPVKTVDQYLLQFYESGEITPGVYTFSAFCTGNITVIFGSWGGTSLQNTSDNYDNGVASVTFEIPENFIDSSKNQFIYLMCKNSGTVSRVKFERGLFQTLAYKDASGKWQPLEMLDYPKEYARCIRYYYDSCADSEGESGSIKTEVWAAENGSTHYTQGARFPVQMRAAPSISFYSGNKRTPGKVAYGTDGSDAAATPQAVFIGKSGFTQINLIGEDPYLTGNQVSYHYIADARMG